MNSLKQKIGQQHIHSFPVRTVQKSSKIPKTNKCFHQAFISDLSSGLGGSISMVIRYPKEEEEKLSSNIPCKKRIQAAPRLEYHC